MAVIIDCVKQRHGVTALEELDSRMGMTRCHEMPVPPEGYFSRGNHTTQKPHVHLMISRFLPHLLGGIDEELQMCSIRWAQWQQVAGSEREHCRLSPEAQGARLWEMEPELHAAFAAVVAPGQWEALKARLAAPQAAGC